MPFGLRNCPVIFIAMMHDFKALWESQCEEHEIEVDSDNGSNIIMDDVIQFAVGDFTIKIIARCVCMIARKYNLTWKLKKCRQFPDKVEFVGVDIAKNGNTPAESKKARLSAWALPKIPRDIMAFISYAAFYRRWIPYFERKIYPLREIIKEFPIDKVLTPTEFLLKHINVYKLLKNMLLSSPILQRANIKKRFYAKTDFAKVGLGFALCQPDDSPAAIKAMEDEIAGGPCLFELTLNSALRLLPIAFGCRSTIGNEKHFHSHPGECLAALYCILKNRHFLWGKEFTLITDCIALMWIMKYTGSNHAIVRL